MENVPTPGRILVIDLARFYAIALVFYGHFIEEFKLLQNQAAAGHYKFVYSFHMVLFIVLAGYVAKERDAALPVGTFLRQRFFSRLLPFIFFTLLMMIPPLFFEGKFFGLELPSLQGYASGLLSTVFGLPSFCIPSWFLLLIVGVELVHYGAFRFLKDDDTKIITAAAVFYVVGYLFNLKVDLFNPLKGRTIGWNYLFLHEAVTLYGFYLIGIFLRRKRVFMRPVSARAAAPAAVVAFLAVLFTFDRNTGPFTFSAYQDVVILFSSHGHILLFPLTAAAGCALVLLTAQLTPAHPTIVWLGQNTLILMCLNGIFYHYINPPAARWMLATFPNSGPSIFALGCFVTAASLVLCIPLVFLFTKFVPQLVGKPGQKGPFMQNMI